MPRQQPSSKGYKVTDDRFPNDWLEACVLLVAATGVAGGIFALLYLAKLNGAI